MQLDERIRSVLPAPSFGPDTPVALIDRVSKVLREDAGCGPNIGDDWTPTDEDYAKIVAALEERWPGRETSWEEWKAAIGRLRVPAFARHAEEIGMRRELSSMARMLDLMRARMDDLVRGQAEAIAERYRRSPYPDEWELAGLDPAGYESFRAKVEASIEDRSRPEDDD